MLNLTDTNYFGAPTETPSQPRFTSELQPQASSPKPFISTNLLLHNTCAQCDNTRLVRCHIFRACHIKQNGITTHKAIACQQCISKPANLTTRSPLPLQRQDNLPPTFKSQSHARAEPIQLCIPVRGDGQLCAKAGDWYPRPGETVSFPAALTFQALKGLQMALIEDQY